MGRRCSHRNAPGIAAALGLCGLLWAGCTGQATAPTPDLSQYNVIVVVIDALRADHLGCYGYGKPTSPFLDRLASESVIFDRAQSNSSYTNESISCLFSGQLPSANPWGTGGLAMPNPDRPTLAERFKAAGYVTCLVSESTRFNYPAYFRGFDETEVLLEYGVSGLTPRLARRALQFVREHRGARKFLYLHILDPHAPYEPTEESYHRFTSKPIPKEERLSLLEVRENLPALRADGFGPGETRFEDLVSRYDAEIASVDHHLGRLFDDLRAMGQLDHTLVVVMADHGEEFLEHGFVDHSWQLYWESLRIPLLLWAPGVFQPGRIADRVCIADLTPTLLTLAGVPFDAAEFDGTALYRRAAGAWQFCAPGKPIFAELMVQTRPLLRAVQYGEYLYIGAQRRLTVAAFSEAARAEKAMRRAFASGEKATLDILGPVIYEECYDMAADPGQRVNLAATDAGACAEGRNLIEAYMARCPKPAPDEVKRPKTTKAEDEEMRRQLDALGYLGVGPDPSTPDTGAPEGN